MAGADRGRAAEGGPGRWFPVRLLSVSVTYKNTPLSELERVAVSTEALGEALPCLTRAPDILEAIILSTCNRTEVYAWVKDPEPALHEIRMYLEDSRDLPQGWMEGRATVLVGEEVVRHLFAVTAGLDSMVQGEPEIQGQVRGAYKAATDLGGVGPHLHAVFRAALEAGKRARSTTGLDKVSDSLPTAAVRAVKSALGDLSQRKVLVVGSGKMASASLRELSAAGAQVGVAARRIEAAEKLAERLGVFALPIEALEQALTEVDAAIFATAAPHPLLGTAALDRVMEARNERHLAVIDLGVPRNVDPRTADLDGRKCAYSLFDLERLDQEGFTHPGGREGQLKEATDIVLAEAAQCMAWFRSRPADAIIAAIQEHAARVSEIEAKAAAKKVAGLDERQRAAVEMAIRRGIRKIVHLPTIRAKEACSRGDDAIVEAARWLFGLDGEALPGHGVADKRDVG